MSKKFEISKKVITFAALFELKCLTKFNLFMNRYETVFIATPVLSDAQLKELFGKFRGVITENGGQIVNEEEWGLKNLAYPIQKKTTGYYFLLEFSAEGNIVEKLETAYRRDERIIRFLTFRLDKYAIEYAEKRKNQLNKKKEE